METKTQTTSNVNHDQRLTKVFNPIFLYLNSDQIIRIDKVFLFPNSDDTFIGKLKLWNDYASFYIVFKKHNLKELKLKGYKNCLFLPNIFKFKTDKNGINFLSCTNSNADAMLKYYPVETELEYSKYSQLSKNGTDLFIGLSDNSKMGIVYEIVKL